MLAVVLDSAAWALGAESGAIYLVDPMDSGLHVEVSRGIEPAAFRIRAGEGIAGRSALTSTTVLVPSDGAPAPAASEPLRATAVAVPLIRGDRTAGVVALYGRVGGEPFSLQEGSTLAAFAREAAVAVENVLSHQQAERLSMTDALTGAGNRRVLEVSLAREIERARRYRRSVSLLMVDIDRFKRVNDDLGHQRGDQVLVEVARRLEESLRRDVDTIVRYGGEEFVVVLPETEEAGAVEVAERARAAVAEEPFGHSVALEVGSANGRTQRGTLQTALSVTVSVGVASYPEDGDSSDALIRAADLAMYAAKGRGGDQVACTKRSGMGGAGLVG